jgi:hypothetical protein
MLRVVVEGALIRDRDSNLTCDFDSVGLIHEYGFAA